MIIWLFFNAMCVCIYMYVHPEININVETRHFCIKMRRKHQHNSSCFFLTEKCQVLHVVKLWATWWVGFGWVERCLSSTELCFLLEPGPSTCSHLPLKWTMGSRFVGSLAWLQRIWVGWPRAGLNFNYWNAFTALHGKVTSQCRMGLDCTLYLCLPF